MNPGTGKWSIRRCVMTVAAVVETATRFIKLLTAEESL